MIRPAQINEYDALTQISFKSKGYWNYPKHYFDIWEKELTISPEYIKKNTVFVIEKDGLPIGFYSILNLETDVKISDILIPKGYWLDHMFILPEFIGKGFGKMLFRHLKETSQELKIEVLNILADPNSKKFYEKMGCIYIKGVSLNY